MREVSLKDLQVPKIKIHNFLMPSQMCVAFLLQLNKSFYIKMLPIFSHMLLRMVKLHKAHTSMNNTSYDGTFGSYIFRLSIFKKMWDWNNN